MATFEEMSLEEVDAAMARLRDLRRSLKQTDKVTERKVAVLARRREKLMEKVQVLDEQIDTLRRELNASPVAMPRRRGRRPKSA